MTSDALYRLVFNEWKWCSCGQPWKALDLLRDVLLVLDARTHSDKNWDESYDKLAAAVGASERYSRVEEFILHQLDAWGLTEHGGSVGGCWLNDFGGEVLDSLIIHGCDPGQWIREA